MIGLARGLHAAVIGLWVGGLLALGAVAAPAVFSAAPSRAVAGTVFGAVLTRFDLVELAFAGAASACILFLVVREPRDRRPWPRCILTLGMALLAVATAWGVHPAVTAERARVGSFDALPADAPERARFDGLHRASVRLSSAKLLIGLFVLGAAVRAPKPAGSA